MKLVGAQLFVRNALDNGKYLICGLIKSNEQLKENSVYTIASIEGDLLLVEDREEETVGKALDQVMKTPIWRLR